MNVGPVFSMVEVCSLWVKYISVVFSIDEVYIHAYICGVVYEWNTYTSMSCSPCGVLYG